MVIEARQGFMRAPLRVGKTAYPDAPEHGAEGPGSGGQDEVRPASR